MDEEMILEFPQKLIEHHLAFSNGRKLALKNWETSFQRAWGNLFCRQEFTKRRGQNTEEQAQGQNRVIAEECELDYKQKGMMISHIYVEGFEQDDEGYKKL